MSTETSPLEVEMALLGGIVMEPSRFTEAAEIIGTQHFVFRGNALVFDALGAMIRAGERPNFLSLRDRLHKAQLLDAAGGEMALMGIINSAYSGEDVTQHARMIFERAQDAAITRLCQQTMHDLAGGADRQGVLHRLQAQTDTIAEGLVSTTEIVTGLDVSDAYMEHMRQFKAGTLRPVKTGVPVLDNRTGGKMPGDLWVWAARPNVGKSVTMLASTIRSLKGGVPVGVISMDMGQRRFAHYMMRMLASASGGLFRPEHWEDDVVKITEVERDYDALRDKISDISKLLYVVPQPVKSIPRVRGYIRKMARMGCRDIIIDQAQNFAEYDTDSRGSCGQVVKAAKDAAKDFDVPVTLVHQINRAGNDEPRLVYLKDSGAFEEYSDVVILLHDIERSFIDQHGAFVDEGHGKLRKPVKADTEGPVEERPIIHRNWRNPRPLLVNVAKTRNGEAGKGRRMFDFEQAVWA